MAAKNTVEATLRTRYEDAITKGIGQTERALKQGMSAMQSGAASMAAGMSFAFESATGWLSGFADKLRQEAARLRAASERSASPLLRSE